MTNQNTRKSTKAPRAAPASTEMIVEPRPPGSVALDRPLPRPAKADPASSYIARLAEGSRRTQTFAVKKIVVVCGGAVDVASADPTTFPWEQFTFEHSRAFLLRMEKEGLGLATMNRHIAALRGVLKEAWRMGVIATDQYMKAIDPLSPRKGVRLPKGRQITDAELSALTDVCKRDIAAGNLDALTIKGGRLAFYGYRDLVMFSLLGFGLREHEVVKALIADYAREEDGATLRVVGKGNKEREVPVSESAAKNIDTWLTVRPSSYPDTIIVGADGQAITPPALTVMLQKRAKEAGVKNIASHDFRRTFISNMLEAGVDIAIVQAIVGHADTSTTARYDRRGMKTKHAAVKKVKWV